VDDQGFLRRARNRASERQEGRVGDVAVANRLFEDDHVVGQGGDPVDFRGSDAVGAQKVGERVGRKLVQGAAGNPGDLRIGVLEHREWRAYTVVFFQWSGSADRGVKH